MQSLKSFQILNCKPASAKGFFECLHMVGALLAWRQDVTVKVDDSYLTEAIEGAKPDIIVP